MPISRRFLLAAGPGLLLWGCTPPGDELPTPTVKGSASIPTAAIADSDPAVIAAAASLVRAGLPKQRKPVATLKIKDGSSLNGGRIHLWEVRSTAESCILTWAITYPGKAGSTNTALHERFIPTLRVGDTVIRASQSLPNNQAWRHIVTPQNKRATKAVAGFALYAPLGDDVTKVTVGADASGQTAKLTVKRGAAKHPTGTAEIPILGRALALDRALPNNKTAMIITVHGVRRLPRATAVYYSLAFPEGVKPIDPGQWGGQDSILRQSTRPTTSMLANTHLVDHTAMQGYSTILDNGLPLGPDLSLLQVRVIDKHTAGVAWSLLPTIPSTTREVDLIIGGHYFQSIPVEEGPMTPISPEDYVPLGAGWPAITADDPAEVNKLGHGEYAATIRDNASAKGITKTGDGNLDLDANVLFKSGTATLTSKAAGLLERASTQIEAMGKPGQLTVTGFTDSRGSAVSNRTRSEAQASAVAEALKKYLPPSYSSRIVGVGESEPIASNDSARGRARNRRISITLPN